MLPSEAKRLLDFDAFNTLMMVAVKYQTLDVRKHVDPCARLGLAQLCGISLKLSQGDSGP